MYILYLLFPLGISHEIYPYAGQNWTLYNAYNYSTGLQQDVPYRVICQLPIATANFNMMMSFRNNTGGGLFTAQMYRFQGKTSIQCQTTDGQPNQQIPIAYNFTRDVSFYFGYDGENYVVITQGATCQLNGAKTWKNIDHITASYGFLDDKNHNFSHERPYCGGIRCISCKEKCP